MFKSQLKKLRALNYVKYFLGGMINDANKKTMPNVSMLAVKKVIAST